MTTSPLSTDLRKRVIKAVDDGMSCRSAAKQFGVAPSTAIKWVDRWRRTGSYEALPQGGDRHSWRIEQYADEVLAQIEATPDITLNELADWLEETHGLKISHVAVWRMLKRHDVTYKKNSARFRAATPRCADPAPGLGSPPGRARSESACVHR